MNEIYPCLNCNQLMDLTEFQSHICRGKMSTINVSNQELIQKSKDIHGELYHKINSLQRDLNISLENNKRLQDKIDELRKTSFTPAEHSEIIKSFKQAINLLEQ